MKMEMDMLIKYCQYKTTYRDLVEVNRFIKKSEEKRKQEEKGDANQKGKDAEKKELDADANYNIINLNIIIFSFINHS